MGTVYAEWLIDHNLLIIYFIYNKIDPTFNAHHVHRTFTLFLSESY